MNVDIAKLLSEGKSVEDIKAIVAVEIAKAQKENAKVPTLAEIGERVAQGNISTKDMFVLLVEYVKIQVPEVAAMDEFSLTGADLDLIEEMVEQAIKEVRVEIGAMIALSQALGVDLKDMIGDGLLKPKAKITDADAEAVLKAFKQSLKPTEF